MEREASAAASLVASMEAGWFHQAPVWSDLSSFDARPWRGSVHILASGDPCQDNSVAGKRAGAEGQRFLAPEVVRVARECRPDLIVRENVPGNAAEQLSALVPPLERLGYRVAAGIFSSAATGNTMRRERLFVMACATGERSGETRADSGRSAQWAGGAGRASGGTQGVAGWSEQQSGGAWGRRAGPAGTGDAMDGTERTERRSDGQSCRTAWCHTLSRREKGAAWPRAPSKVGGGSSGTESQGQQRGQHHTIRRQVERGHPVVPSGTVLPPAVIPDPTDSRWRDVLDRWPELQPALSAEEAESHLRRGVDAMAHRIERLRATGNGVDPVVAATAFLRLNALLAASSGSGHIAVAA